MDRCMYGCVDGRLDGDGVASSFSSQDVADMASGYRGTEEYKEKDGSHEAGVGGGGLGHES